MKIADQYLHSLTIVCFLFCFIGQGKSQNKSQTPTFINGFEFAMVIDNEKSRIGLSDLKEGVSFTLLNHYIELFETKKKIPSSSIILGVSLSPYLTNYSGSPISSFTKTYRSYNISDTSSATLIALGITTKNINDYRYRVVENDSNEIVPWSPIPMLEQKYGTKRPYGYIGKFKYPGKLIMVEVVNRKNYNVREGVFFYWTSDNKPIINDIGVTIFNRKTAANEWHSLKEYATKFDKVTGLPLNMSIPNDFRGSIMIFLKKQPTINFTYDIINKTPNGKDTIRNNHASLSQDGYFIRDYSFNAVGKHELIIRRQDCPNYSDENVIRLQYEVYMPNEVRMKELRTKILVWTVFVLFLAINLFLIHYRYSRRKLKKALQQKEKANLQLKVIRSQLNPHFTFNALNSIQNLMNRNDVEAANHYLVRFSSLTRRVLTSSDNDLISLADEITLMDDYLQMEQLRFGFKYSINVDAAINKENIEIPAMLLQPFAENAVKHGVATLRESGRIEINFARQGKDLMLSVTDNGTGFSEEKLQPEHSGMGLKLSRERIALLNNIYTNQYITINVTSNSSGTKISITLGDWL